MAEKTKVNIKFLNKSFQDFLHRDNKELLFITPRDAHEVKLLIPLLNSNKFTGQKSLPSRILKL